MLIGPDFKPFYAAGPRARTSASRRGRRTQWKIGGGTVWGWISYDPELDLIYYGTGNPGPWNPEQRPGDNKWTSGIFARDPDTGEARWSYQWSPHDLLRLRRRQRERSCSTCRSTGSTRKVLVRPERNGYIYVLDRATGEVLSADPFVHITVGARRRPEDRPADPERREGAARSARWCATSARPRRARRTGSRRRSRRARGCSTSRTTTCAWTTRAWRRTTSPARRTSARTCGCTPGPGGTSRRVHGVGPGGSAARRGASRRSSRCGAARVATAGDVVFYGTMDGWFKAVDARTGEAALAVPDRLGDHRPADHLPRAGRQAVRRGAVRRRRLGGGHRGRRPRPAATRPRRSASWTR